MELWKLQTNNFMILYEMGKLLEKNNLLNGAMKKST